MLNQQLGEKEKVANFLILIAAVVINFVKTHLLVVTGKQQQQESAAQIPSQVVVMSINIFQIQFVLIKILNLKI